jgi:hypothetical protein
MSKATTNHDEIRRWAESKGGKPAAVDRTHKGEDVGIIRLMFPDNKQSEHQSLVEISWDAFFEQFEESKLALLYEEDSLFSKMIGRDTLEKREHGEHASRHHPDPRAGKQAEAKGSGGSKQAGGKKDAGRQRGEGGDRGKASSAQGQERQDGDDLKSREYRDAEGNIHHHTRTYEQQHGQK